MPYGAYDRFPMASNLADGGFVADLITEATSGDKIVFTALEPMIVMGFRLLIMATINYDTPTAIANIALDKRVAFGSDTNRVELAVIILPDGIVAGKVLYKNITPVKLLPGQQLVVKVKVAGVGTTSSGSFKPFVIAAPAPETPGNCPNMQLTA